MQQPTQPAAQIEGFPSDYRALVIGASGAIGQAFCQQLHNDSGCAQVLGIGRHSLPKLDLSNEQSIVEAAQAAQSQGPFNLIINATGLLHTPEHMPEKKLADLNFEQLISTFQINTFGPALLLRHFTPLLDKRRGVMALLSAKVGSISDNRLGGWYSYRASKAALNMLVKTAAIELARSQPNSVLLALHPGTVSSRLSAPFQGARLARPASDAVAEMLALINQLGPADSGRFYAYNGEKLPW